MQRELIYNESIKDICHANRCHITHMKGLIPHEKTKITVFILNQRNLGTVKLREIQLFKKSQQ